MSADLSHSPLPWGQAHRKCLDSGYRTQVFDRYESTIADLTWAPMPEVGGVIGTYRGANAEFIVRCVNSHEALVSALRDLVQRLGAIDLVRGSVSLSTLPEVTAAVAALSLAGY